MKTFVIILWVIGLLVTAFSSLLVIEFRNNVRFRIDIADKKRELDDVDRAKIDIEKFKKEIIQLRVEDSLVEKRIPKNEDNPLTLIKKLTLMGSQSGIEKIEFIYEDSTANKQGQVSSFVSKSDVSSRIKPFSIKMEFECEFKQLYSFLKDIFRMERLVLIEGIEIKRLENILPRQTVSIEVNAYTFTGQNSF